MNFEHGRSTTVTTDKGQVRGFKHNGIYHFWGLDYAYADRYQVPVECEPWEGVKEATNYGYICPPQKGNYLGNHIKNPYRYWPMSDHCQNLNVWTRDLDPTKKKPVVFWLHGGGFSDGSSIEHQAYDGFNMAKYSDLCVVTVNHRLNCLGYLDLSSFGEKYARSANLGMLDIVKALEWVKRNIATFGGDPDNVTIFGQSGGGGKVHTLMNMPAADGLYHKAMIMSGVTETHGVDRVQDQRPIILKAMELLGLKEDEVEKLETWPHRELMDALMEAAKQLGTRLMMRPTKNVDFLGDCAVYGYSDYAKNIPLVIGGVFAEFRYQFYTNYLESDTDDCKAKELIAEKYGPEKAEKLVPLFQKVFPEKKLVDFLNLETSSFRAGTKEVIAKRLSEECPAPTWNYLFAPVCGINEHTTPVHSYEIPFFFHNTELIPSNDLGGDATEKVELQCSERLANYARYGRPDLPGQTVWPVCTKEATPTLIIDDVTRVECNYDDEIVKIINE